MQADLALDSAAGRRAALATAAWLRGVLGSRAAGARLTADSRALRRDDVFLAWPGARSDGRDHIAAALDSGAAAVLWDNAAPFAWPATCDVPNRAVPDLKQAAGAIAAAWYGQPAERLRVVGVTGASGKSTCAWWTAQALTTLGERCAVAGTLGIGFIPDGSAAALRDTGKTTPDPVELQASLAQLVEEGARALAMEVSSIGLVEGRVNGMKFDIALFTNLSRDHLDYHGSMAAYEQAKARLFAWPGLSAAVVNIDDACGQRLADLAATRGIRLVRVSAAGTASADLRASAVGYGAGGLAFTLEGAFGRRQVATPLIGTYNLENWLCVLGVLLVAGYAPDAAIGALARLVPAPGRLEPVTLAGVRAGAAPLVLVDYAHKPDALEKVLAACRPLAAARGGRLVLVFGCGGDRDAGKRPLMGAIAAQGADRVIVTSDNPRSEDPRAIIDQIVAGANAVACEIEPDRRTAIHAAIAGAGAHDVVVIAGKGHETYQEVAGRKLPFSDPDAARGALAARAGVAAEVPAGASGPAAAPMMAPGGAPC